MSTELTMRRLRGIAALVFRRLLGLKQHEAAPLVDMTPKQISALEHGIEATPEALDRSARAYGVSQLHQVQALSFLESLDRSLAQPQAFPGNDPFAPSPEELRAALARTSTAALVVEQWSTEQIRLAKIALARDTAALQWERLSKCLPHQRLAFVDSAPEFHHFALAQLLMAKSFEVVGDEAAAALERAELALAVAFTVGSCRLLSHAFGYVGNALRIHGALDDAEAALDRADALWDFADDDGGLLDPGRLLSFRASLCRDQRRLAEANCLLERALPLSREPGRILLKMGSVLEHLGRYEAAMEALSKAEEHLLDKRDEFLLHLDRGVVLCHLGRHAEAAALARAAAILAATLKNHLDELRALWLQARVSAGTGDLDTAINNFETVRQEFSFEGLDYDVALVTLELANVLLEARRLAEAAALADALVPAFSSRRIHREALAALVVASKALRERSATPDLIRRITSFLYSARSNQDLRFAL